MVSAIAITSILYVSNACINENRVYYTVLYCYIICYVSAINIINRTKYILITRIVICIL